MAVLSRSPMSTRMQNDRQSVRFQLVPKHATSPLLMNVSQPMVIPVHLSCSSTAAISGSQGSPYLKSSSYPIGLLGPHCGHVFTSAQSCQTLNRLGGAYNPTQSPTCTPLSLPLLQPSEGTPTFSTSTNSPRLWHREFRYTSLNSKEIRSHINNTLFRNHSSCDHVRTAYGCHLSPFIVRTLAISDNLIPESPCIIRKGEGPSPGFSCNDMSQLPCLVTTSNNDVETENDSSSHSKHSSGQFLETESIPHQVCNEIHTYSETGSAKHNFHSGCSRGASKERKGWSGDYDEFKGEGEGEEKSYYSECVSESDDEIVFSDKHESTTQEDNLGPCIPYQTKAPSRHLVTLLSEESGFRENSCTESYSDSEWDSEEEESKSESEGHISKDSNETWKQFEEQALSFSPAISPPHSHCSISVSLDGTHPLPHSSSASSQQNTSATQPKHCQSPLKLMQRLSKHHVHARRHRNCCLPSTHKHSRMSECPTTSCPKKVSFVCDSELVHVHHIIVWNYAYRSCRKGPWEQYARDREHFRCRIDRVSSIIEPCLQKKLKSLSTSPNQ